ncbi:MAG: hypothetical protein A2Z03_08530 [Chloroflexi bacterium RBG_16_56_8]|nr:MAG: hypothetical protein A2Z03_08530 [Chloroflexi bacterium RBG_16_56_8]
MNRPTETHLDWQDLPLRIGLLSTAMILFYAGVNLWNQGQPFSQPLSLLVSFGTWLFGMALAVLATLPRLKARLAWLVLVGVVVTQLVYAGLSWLSYSPLTASHSDNEMIAQFAVQALERGQNPYTWNFSDVLRVYRDRGLNLTPFLDGSTQNRVTYPALPTLMLLALDTFGIDQVRVMSLLFQIVLLILIFKGTPEHLRALVVIPLFILRDIVVAPVGGVQDAVWSALLVAMVLAWKRPWARAVLFGLAGSFRQQPWFVLPFLLIYLWNQPGTLRDRLQQIAQFVAISVGTFLLINLPFIVWDPMAWFLGVFEPAYAAFNMYSHGLGALSQFGIVPFPREFYSALQFSFLILALVVHWRHPHVIGQAFWIFPGIFFWLYYRGLANYWIYWLPPLLIALTRGFGKDVQLPQASPFFNRRWISTLGIAAALVAANLIFQVQLLQHAAPVQANLRLPINTLDYGEPMVHRLRISVTNQSDAVLTPRFAVQRDPGIQALPWNIDSGQQVLQPRESGDYVISASVPSRFFPASTGGQVVVTDAGGNYALRAVLTIPPDETFAKPDLILNPTYAFWRAGENAPEGWSLQTNSRTIASAEIREFAGRVALGIHSPPGSFVTRLEQDITFPDSFSIWVYPTSSATDPSENAYGVEIDDGERRLWILFGESDKWGKLDNGAFVYLNAPLNMWSKQNIDLRGLYAQLGWPLPVSSLRGRNGLEVAAPQAQISLLVAGNTKTDTVQWFGPIEQTINPGDPSVLLAQVFAHPDSYYVTRGDEYRRARNYQLAEESYQRALRYNDLNAAAYFGIAESRFWRGDYSGAIEAYNTSLAFSYPSAGSAQKGIAWSEYNLGRFAQAQHHFEQAIRANPELADAYNGLGWTAIQQHDCPAALPNLEIASRFDPTLANAKTGLQLCQSAVPPVSSSR